MNIKKRMLSNMFLRNMISDLFGRSGNYNAPGTFIPYFQYKIGDYQTDHFLYFQKEPFGLRYYNEFFNKLNEYFPGHIPDYLEFHFSAYSDKQGFLKFLRHEISGRLKQKIGKTRSQKLEIAQEWVWEKLRELHSQQQIALKLEIEKDVREILPAETTVNFENIENIAKTLSERLADHIDHIMVSTEERMQTLTESYITGNIGLVNKNHEEKVMKLFKLIQKVQAPQHVAKAEQLFGKFSDTDIAAILRLHFEAFKSKRLNTVQTNIKSADERIPDKSPKVQKLEEALQQFFYS